MDNKFFSQEKNIKIYAFKFSENIKKIKKKYFYVLISYLFGIKKTEQK